MTTRDVRCVGIGLLLGYCLGAATTLSVKGKAPLPTSLWGEMTDKERMESLYRGMKRELEMHDRGHRPIDPDKVAEMRQRVRDMEEKLAH